jgi:hypothetical protein
MAIGGSKQPAAPAKSEKTPPPKPENDVNEKVEPERFDPEEEAASSPKPLLTGNW